MDGGSACACHETRRHGLGLRQEAVKSDLSKLMAKTDCLTCICILIVLTSIIDLSDWLSLFHPSRFNTTKIIEVSTLTFLPGKLVGRQFFVPLYGFGLG